MKPGGDKMLALVADLARSHGVSVSSMALDDLEDALAAGRRARALLTTCKAITVAVTDMVHRTDSTVWSGTTLYYSILARVANHDPVLLDALEPANAYFGRRSAAVKKQRTLARAERQAAHAGRKAEEAARKSRAVHDRIEAEAPATTQSPPVSRNAAGAQGAFAPNGAASVNGTSTSNGFSHA